MNVIIIMKDLIFQKIVDLRDLGTLNMNYDRLQLQPDGLYHVVKKESI